MKSKLTVFATLALSIHYAHAVERVWADSAGNTNWTSGASWVGGTAPINSATTDSATFTSVTNAQPYLNVGATTRSVTGIDFQLPDGGLNFTSDAGSILRLGAPGIDATTQLSGENTVSVTNMRLEGGSHTWNLFSNTTNSSTSTFSVSSNIELATDLIVLPNRNSGTGNVGIVNLSGNISESGGIRALNLRGASANSNTINLTGTSSYTGTTTIQQVTVTANSLANATVNSALGNSGTIILGSNAAVARLTFQNLTVDGSTDRLLSLKGTLDTQPYILANNDADNTISFTNAGNTGDTVGTYATDLIFALGGTNTGNNTFGQVINDRNATNKTSLRKENGGTWVLTNSNTYTGETVVNGGLLRVDNAAALGVGNLDVSGAVLGLAAGDLTTRTVGTGAGQVQWSGSGGFAAFGANRTVHFGTPTTTINWTATNFIGDGNTLILGHATADGTLIWDQQLNLSNGSRTVQVNNGSAAIDAKMSRFVTGGSTVAANIFNKTGTGTLALTANNFYNGDTNVNEGTLMIGDGGGTGGTGSTTPNIIVASGATLAVNRNNTLIQGTTNLITAISGNGGFAQVGSGTTEFTLANVYKGPTAVSAGALLINGDNSAATGAVTVAAGTATGTPVAKLGGTGTGTNGRIGGNVILTAESASGFKNGGVLAPTAAADGTKLSVAGTTTFNTGSLFEWNLNAATSDTGTTNQGNYGQLAGTGVIGGSGAVFKIVLGSNNFDDAFWDTNKTWNNLFTGDGADNTLASIFSSFSGTGVSSTGVVDGQGQFSFSDTSTLHWTFTAVPEPTSALAGLLLAAGLVRRRRPVAVACNLRRLI